MIVSSASYVIVKYSHPESLELRKLKERGAVASGDRDTSLPGKIEIADLIEKDFEVIHPGEKLRTIIVQAFQPQQVPGCRP